LSEELFIKTVRVALTLTGLRFLIVSFTDEVLELVNVSLHIAPALKVLVNSSCMSAAVASFSGQKVDVNF
jgi:hypothetical protein